MVKLLEALRHDLSQPLRETRAEGREVDAAGLERIWRENVPQPVAPRPDK
jgi:hypothetical protein